MTNAISRGNDDQSLYGGDRPDRPRRRLPDNRAPFSVFSDGRGVMLVRIAFDVNPEDEVALHVRLKGAGDDAVLGRGQPHSDVRLAAVLPRRRFGHAFVESVVA